MQITLAKGHDSINFFVPEEKILGLLYGKEVPSLSEESVARSISAGIRDHAPADIAALKTAIIIPDDTRLWARGDVYVPVILQSLFDLGVPAANVNIIIALGTHADIAAERFAALAGRFSVEHVEILNSANRNEQRLVHLGETRRKVPIQLTTEVVDADHIIIYGGVLHHMTAGYGGGRKYIFPGVGGYDAIQKNHSLAMCDDGSPHPNVRQMQLQGNPVNEDLEEIAELVLRSRSCTYAAVAANGRGEIFHAEVGPLQQTFQNSCTMLDEVCCVSVLQKADFALISTGGHRADGQLYQATKALFNAVGVVKEGGAIVFVAGCSEGSGNDIFAHTLLTYKNNKNGLGQKLASTFNMPAYVAFRVLDILDRFEVSLVSDLSCQQTVAFGFNYVEDLQNYVNNLQGSGYIIPFAENVLPVIG